ncbi:UNVERIFIED_CONTAM: Arogenate dehydrogenase 2, chloroplastic [Sesamum latifolium]|uniref:Arogenate dehydrogenase 2, chloroplastic n=1 Tax=Sesamum latifolium TaxID=2727402 RepID=A0AAW2VGF0_9LAMI
MSSFSSLQPTTTQAPPAAAAGVARRNSLIPCHCAHQLSVSSFPAQQLHSGRRHRFRVRAIDAAQPYDYEAHLVNRFTQSTKLKIAIVGFGNFGQFLAKAFVRQGHMVYAHSRSNYQSIAQSLGAAFFSDLHDLCEQHPDVILICTSIISTESVLRAMPLQRLRRNTLFVDVLSVKEFRRIFPSTSSQPFRYSLYSPDVRAREWETQLAEFALCV